MRVILYGLLLLAALLIFTTTADAKVVDLTSKEQVKFELSKPGPIILMYYTSWCPACQAAKPAFEQTSNEVKDVRFYSMNSENIALFEHKDFIHYIPRFMVGPNETTLRNSPCQDGDELDRTVVGFKKFINKCLGK